MAVGNFVSAYAGLPPSLISSPPLRMSLGKILT